MKKKKKLKMQSEKQNLIYTDKRCGFTVATENFDGKKINGNHSIWFIKRSSCILRSWVGSPENGEILRLAWRRGGRGCGEAVWGQC